MIQPAEEYMTIAIEAARESASKGDYGIGAVIVKNNNVVAVGYETLKSTYDPVNGHAEIDAIRKACLKLESHYLEDCILYSTHEPCPMCTSASIWAKVDTIVFSVSRDDMIAEMEKQSNGKFSWRQIAIPCQDIIDKGTPKITVVSGYMRDEGLKLFNSFS